MISETNLRSEDRDPKDMTKEDHAKDLGRVGIPWRFLSP